MKDLRLTTIAKTRRVVVKIGTSVLIDDLGKLSRRALGGIAAEIAFLQNKGIQTLLVSSGAIASGMQALGIQKRPHALPTLQACAAVGQPLLVELYRQALSRAKLVAAQVLLTRDDLEDRQRFLNAKETMAELIQRGVIPIINENDTVSVEEIRVGDNDNLAALVTNLVQADLLVLLTDRDGLFTADPARDPEARLVPIVENIDQKTLEAAFDTSREESIGGMKTKLAAAHKAAQFGIPTIIANGRQPQVLKKLLEGHETGTLFLPSVNRLAARKHWIAHTLKSRGRLIVDAGARRALTDGKKSLLPSGLIRVEGTFARGEAVEILVDGEAPFARGLAAYAAMEIEKIRGRKSAEIEGILGFKGTDEVVHRDDLVLL